MEDIKTKPTSIIVPAELVAKADRMAAVRGISRNKLIKMLIEYAPEEDIPPMPPVHVPMLPSKDKVPA